MFEHLRSQLARDPAHLVERAANGLPRLVELASLLGRCLRYRVELEEDSGEDLPDLVVEVACNSDALALLGGEDPAAAFLSLALEPAEHSVERRDDTADLVVANDIESPGLRRSTVSIRSASRPNGAKARRSRMAFAETVTTRPPSTIAASVKAIGALIVTGVTRSRIAMSVSSPTFTARTRQ
jgi:hypothetical protein